MAQWKFGLNSKGSALTSKVDYSNKQHVDWEVSQHNIDDILKQVQRDKDILDHQRGKRDPGWRKAFTVPDIVAMEILQNHHIDLHAEHTMSDPALMKKFKAIIKSEYPYLLIST